jgi:hypothetical protein
MTRALFAAAQGCQARIGLAGALLLLLAPTAWAGTSSQQNPSVTFTTPGTKQVTLQVCNANGCTSVTQAVTVRNPVPAITAATFSPLLPEAGQLVLLTGAGTGKPPLAFTWQAALTGGSPFASLPGSTAWWNTAGLPAGVYTVSLQAQNGSGTAALPVPITLAPAAPLDFYSVTPCRLYDSRQATALLSGAARSIQGSGTCGIPASARALAANVTVIASTGTGSATLYPGNYPQPVASTTSFSASATRATSAVLPLATDGSGTLTALLSIAGANASAHMVIDVSGYFRP